jgi:hypothetical protein
MTLNEKIDEWVSQAQVTSGQAARARAYCARNPDLDLDQLEFVSVQADGSSRTITVTETVTVRITLDLDYDGATLVVSR